MDFQAPNTLAEQIAGYMAERIMTGQIQPGQRIQEANLATELKVSRASVKEALYTLERWHLVEITPRKGASATQINAEYAAELYDVYMHLLIMLATRLCERWEEDDKPMVMEAVNRILATVNEPGADITAVVEASFGVMEAACAVVNNPYLTESLSNFKPAVSRTYYLSAQRYRQGLTHTLRFFTELQPAVLARDTAKVRTLIEDFAEQQKSLIRKAMA
ncbi:GntR family transcriptional regulator [Marinobacter litoralis]|uniref:GntR family transcriptional regulator n=1 Tax=Marinobacter litoralis TaxID=187981 RepID=UPI0018EC31D6|nr:GntR family transcriptional regulator [Marinobacter litoralis]MBJ6137019.1 GntR family transcriptional regulator [Marinobacter litoralis]